MLTRRSCPFADLAGVRRVGVLGLLASVALTGVLPLPLTWVLALEGVFNDKLPMPPSKLKKSSVNAAPVSERIHTPTLGHVWLEPPPSPSPVHCLRTEPKPCLSPCCCAWEWQQVGAMSTKARRHQPQHRRLGKKVSVHTTR